VVTNPGVAICILNQAFTNAFPLALRATQEQTSPTQRPKQPLPITKAAASLGSQPNSKAKSGTNQAPWVAKYSEESTWPTKVPATPPKAAVPEPATAPSDPKWEPSSWSSWSSGWGQPGKPDKRWATAQEVQERKRAVAWQLEELRQAEQRVKNKKLEEEEQDRQKKAKEDQAKAEEQAARQTKEEEQQRLQQAQQQQDQYQQGIATAQFQANQAQFQTAAAMAQQAHAMWQMEQQQWQQQQWKQQQQDQWRPNRHGWPKQDLRDEGRYKRLVEKRNQLQKEKVDLEEQLAAKERGYSGEGKRSCSLTKKRCEETSLAFRGRSKS